jgi:hypothetical protein
MCFFVKFNGVAIMDADLRLRFSTMGSDGKSNTKNRPLFGFLVVHRTKKVYNKGPSLINTVLFVVLQTQSLVYPRLNPM